MIQSYRGHKGRPFIFSRFPWTLNLCLPPNSHPGHGIVEAKRAVSLLLQPSYLQTAWDQKGAPEVASPEPYWLQLCCWPLGWEGLEGAHSQDVSGWVCLLWLQEALSTCPRNAGGGIHACFLHPLVLSAGHGRERAPSGQKGI